MTLKENFFKQRNGKLLLFYFQISHLLLQRRIETQ